MPRALGRTFHFVLSAVRAFAADAALYLPSYIAGKTEIGQLYGGKGEMDLEALLTAAPDVVIDIGEPKKTTAEDLTTLTAQTGIPFVHISATVATAPDAYRMLGNTADAEDMTQRTFIRVWKAADSYEPEAQFSTWLFTIVKHLVYNESRRRQRKHFDPAQVLFLFKCGNIQIQGIFQRLIAHAEIHPFDGLCLHRLYQRNNQYKYEKDPPFHIPHLWVRI